MCEWLLPQSSVKSFGKALMRKVSNASSGWQRRFCFIDSKQRSFVYGIVHHENSFQERWELRGHIFLGGGCQVALLAFQMGGRPGCFRLRPRVGAKLKDYTLAAETLADSKSWVAALEAAGAERVEPNQIARLEPCGVFGVLLHKLGGGALKEWQARWTTVEADGLLSYYDVKEKVTNGESRTE